jgi:TolB-like protein
MKGDEVRIGPFRVDLAQRELSRDGVSVPLGSRARDILCLLASAKGDLVSKDELMRRVWPGLVVEENTIQVHVSALRRALNEGKSGHGYLVTVQGRGYRLVDACAPTTVDVAEADIRPSLSIPDRPSIAVLPFANLSGDPEQEYFADGIVEELTTALARMRWLLVIARNSSFTYKHKAVDVKQVGRALGVRYVLEGSVRKAAHRVRITAQLIGTATGAHLWADRFDGTLEDIFDLQDRVSASVVGTIAPKLEQSEIERAQRKPTESLDAYDYYLRGLANVHRWTDGAISEALRLFYRAIELDPDFASAYGMAAWCYARRRANGWMKDPEQELADTERIARRAVELGKDDAVALCTAGYALARATGDLDDGAAFIDRALVLNPNLFTAWLSSGWVKTYLGEPDAAISCLAHAMRLSPLDPFLFGVHEGIAFAHLFTGRYDEAASWAEKAIRENPTWTPAWRTAAASYALAERLELARNAMARMRQLDSELRISKLKDTIPLLRAEDLARFAEGLRKAGLPE